MTISERFWKKVDKNGPNGCWIWTAGKNHFGHGRYAVTHTTTQYAHRFSWEEAHSNIPENLCVLHKCDNPSCVNPEHLFLGTKTDNAKDRDKKQRTGRSPGERNGNAKVTTEQIKQIFEFREKDKLSQKEIGIVFGLSQTQIGRILRKERWSHVTF